MKRRFLLVAAMVALVAAGLGAGGAYAYFTSSGSGSGAVSVGTVSAVTVLAATGTPTSDLYPGDTGADLTLTLTNPNSYSLTIVGIAQDGLVTVVGGSGCTSDTGTWPSPVTLGNSGVTVPTQTGLNVPVPLGPGNVIVHVPGGASMTTSSNGGCQGASFQIPVTITVQKG